MGLMRRVRKIRMGTHSVILTLVLEIRSRTIRTPLNSDKTDVDVSLTSYGKRLASVHLVIESIARGTVRPRTITLWVDPGTDRDALSRLLMRLESRGLKIEESPNNFGPHTKYFPHVLASLGRSSRFVTADDDILYPRYWLQRLVESSDARPDVIHGHRVHRVSTNSSGRLCPYNEWRPAKDVEARFDNFATGVSGVIYPPAMSKVLRDAGDGFLAICKNADDVWLHACALSAGIRIAQVGHKPKVFPEILRSQGMALHRSNTAQGLNDPQIAATYSEEVISRVVEDSSGGAQAGATRYESHHKDRE